MTQIQDTRPTVRPLRRAGADGYAAVLVQVQPGPSWRLAAARAVAERFDAILVGVGAEAVPPVAAGSVTGFVQPQWFAACSTAADANLAAAHDAFVEACVGLRAGGEWLQGLDLPADAMARAARGADLVVASRPAGPASPYVDASPADLAMNSGRPVLVLADGAAAPSGERVLLAWKDTRESRRAMADALPFLRAARSVLVLGVTGDSPASIQDNLDDVAEALRRHGVSARIKAVRASGHEARHILEETTGFGADLLVAGGYGRSRVGEWLFGGVTHDLLAQRTRHILLSH